ncbi:hypothetical protein HY504_00570 [Candidatus Wolfebacteria bacterium]|nr:hypothetical protein [Candidatus Wolfebacteria bacterium]
MDDILKQNIIKDLGIDLLPEDKQEEVILRIGKLIFQGVLLRVMDLLGDADKDELEKLMAGDGATPEAVMKFLQQKIPNLDEVVRDEVTEFKKESVEFMQGLTRD